MQKKTPAQCGGCGKSSASQHTGRQAVVKSA